MVTLLLGRKIDEPIRLQSCNAIAFKGSEMSEVLKEFAEPVLDKDGKAYRAQACGAATEDGLWEGWVEFIPLESGETPLRSARETTQPNKVDAAYWAGGLRATYLEGALDRARRGPIVRTVAPAPQPIFDAAAPGFDILDGSSVEPRAILDPFSVYKKGESLLRKELHALSAWHLVNIIVAYRLSEQPASFLNQVSQAALIDLIVTSVRARANVA